MAPPLSTTLPTVVTAAGLQPQPPSTIRAQLIANVLATNPGYSANLPGSLVEDISSTDVASIALCDAARVELVNSLTPFGANPFLLQLLGNIYGVPISAEANTSVYVVFSGNVGFIIPVGFTVSDGTYQYVVQDGGIIGGDGSTVPLFCLASLAGVWSVPSGTVQQIVTSVPSPNVITCNNPLPGTPGTGMETLADYRARTLQAGRAIAQGVPTMTKTVIGNISGVQQRLISVQQYTSGGNNFWEAMVGGGGDPYQIAYALYQGFFDINTLSGSRLAVSGITNANPGVVSTNINHGYTTGAVVTITNVVGMSGINGTPLTITVLTEKTFSIGIDTTSSGAYVSGGTLSPNLRNVQVSILDYPDKYNVIFVNPFLQTVTMTVTWNTTLTNSISAATVDQLAVPALVDYVNGITVGQPMNLFVLQEVFQQAVASAIPPAFLTRLIFAVSIDGNGVSPSSGTGIIAGDPESYLTAVATGITVVQG